MVRLGYCFTPYQRLWLYNGTPLVAFYDTLGIRRTYSRLKPPASSRGIYLVDNIVMPVFISSALLFCSENVVQCYCLRLYIVMQSRIAVNFSHYEITRSHVEFRLVLL